MFGSVVAEDNKSGPAIRNASGTARSAAIKSRALEVGFSKVGVVEAAALAEEDRQLRAWLALGFNGEMKWMERDPQQRTDPRALFPQARSVIVVALNYYTPHQHFPGNASGGDRAEIAPRPPAQKCAAPATGKVSRYAWGDDYHDVLGNKLRDLLAWIKEQWPEAEGKVCVDIQPTMDKAWAARAGLGWMGKHTNIITEEFGSWVFLGELLLNLELACDESQLADQCGSCTLCLDACPTGALVEPYVLDANRCISHATIESRAPEITPGVAEHLEGWFYGCDICQDVCPWNHVTQPATEPQFEPREGNVNADLSQILGLTAETYAARFRRSAMKRAKLSGLQRNARALVRRQ